jgi:hypothetical protein
MHASMALQEEIEIPENPEKPIGNIIIPDRY